MSPRSCQYRLSEGGRPGETRARVALVAAGVAALVVLVAGCWSDGSAISACKAACLPLPVAKMSADGCVCQSARCVEVGRVTVQDVLRALDGGAR